MQNITGGFKELFVEQYDYQEIEQYSDEHYQDDNEYMDDDLNDDGFMHY